MRARTRAVLQVCLALICALGAGFSGDLYAQHGQASHHAGRHARGHHARGARSISRTGQNDQAADLESLHEGRVASAASSSTDSNDLHAIVEFFSSFLAPNWVEVGTAEPVALPGYLAACRLAPCGRAPPSFL